MNLSREQLLDEIARHPRWRHRIRLAPDVVTPGSEDTEEELRRLDLPKDMSRMKVLDVGCSDGYYSFECERRGAGSVLAIDDMSSLLAPDSNGLLLARRILGSEVKFARTSVYDMNPDVHGRFDLVLFLNVIYHLRHPLLALERLRAVLAGNGELYLKSYFHQDLRFSLGGRTFGLDFRRGPWARFYPGGELESDPTNWWGPNAACLRAMLHASGFEQCEEIGRHYNRLYLRCR